MEGVSVDGQELSTPIVEGAKSSETKGIFPHPMCMSSQKGTTS